MPLMLDAMREEFARFLAEDPAGRFRMDAALVHVITLAYRAGVKEGEKAARVPDMCMWVVAKGGRRICQPPKLYHREEPGACECATRGPDYCGVHAA